MKILKKKNKKKNYPPQEVTFSPKQKIGKKKSPLQKKGKAPLHKAPKIPLNPKDSSLRRAGDGPPPKSGPLDSTLQEKKEPLRQMFHAFEGRVFFFFFFFFLFPAKSFQSRRGRRPPGKQHEQSSTGYGNGPRRRQHRLRPLHRRFIAEFKIKPFLALYQ